MNARIKPSSFANGDKDKKKQRYLLILMHILVWGIIFYMPFLSNFRSPKTLSDLFREFRPPIFFALIFYINYFFLIRKFVFTKKIWAFLLVNIGLYICCIFILEYFRDFNFQKIDQATESLQEMDRRPGPSFIEVFLRLFLAFMMTTGVTVAIKITSKWFHSEHLRKELEKEHLKSELLHLKNQLNPHFLFNTLNNIYGLIIQNQEKAQDAVHQLSKLMRYLLYDSNEKLVPLSKEIEFMHHYIDLMRLRLMTNVSVHYAFPKNNVDCEIAPLLFISLIENAFKHGVNLNAPSEIEMEMNLSREKKLEFYVKNTAFPKSDEDRSGSGIGLVNLRKRLKLLYPENHTFTIHQEDKYFECTLTLQL
ncbi:sensor histidine kinase [Flexithrix dorotheae]|uniref:sensor histidine kinase n=1 Tax=Flexithrix dorotheae TaxID=70993 RepID=UPI000371BBC5|nr:histidine kinase [Flexithrix dorotheae]